MELVIKAPRGHSTKPTFFRALYFSTCNSFQNDINYGFSYNVRDDYSGADFGHTESRHADSTEGEYFVLLPDGRVQTVKYNVDPHGGYVAEVNYKGESGHASFKTPTTKHAHRPRPPPRKPAYTLQPLYTPVIHQPLELPLVTRGYSHKPSHPQECDSQN